MRLAIALLTCWLPSFVKCWVYRIIFGARIGKGVKLRFGSFICADSIEIGDRSQFGFFSQVRVKHFQVLNDFKLGHFSKLLLRRFVAGPRATVAYRTEIVGKPGKKESAYYMGMWAWVFQHCYIDVTRSVWIGRNTGIGGRSMLFTHGMWLSALKGFPVAYSRVRLDADVWIPWACFILPGATVGAEVVVGACTMLRKEIPAGKLAVGAPARVVGDSRREVKPEQVVEMLEQTIAEAFDSAGKDYTKRDVDGRLLFESGGETPFVILTDSSASPEPSPNTLNLCLGSIDPSGFSEVVYNATTERCSPASMLKPIHRAFFTAGRVLGMRYYPYDELELARKLEQEEAPHHQEPENPAG
jgi:acetyltransferase-like isoleucine patch superfamily enzyme